MFIRRNMAVAVLGCLLSAQVLSAAEDRFFIVRAVDVAWTDSQGEPQPNGHEGMYNWPHIAARPYVVLDGPGEAVLAWQHSLMNLEDDPPGSIAQELNIDRTAPALLLAVRAPADEVRGRVFLRKADEYKVYALHFHLQHGRTSPIAHDAFYVLKRSLYADLLANDMPGGAWFRHQMREAQAQIKSPIALDDSGRRRRFFGARQSSIEASYALVSGGRAVSENLQLDRELIENPNANEADTEPTIPIDSIEGITIRPFDWKPLLADLPENIELDPAAALIPHDQHAVFFPTFSALVAFADQSTDLGTPVLRAGEPRAEDARTRDRYEKQLGLSLDQGARLFGPTLIRSVAITGSDVYLRTGTDVALLFEATNLAALRSLIDAQIALAASAHADAQAAQGKVGQIAYVGHATADRKLSSYVATVGNFVVVTNSLVQLGQLEQCLAHPDKSLAAQDEYRFFRHRYPRSDARETALAVLTDATIRRWCGPRWRIATSRRTRALAVMDELQARHLAQLVAGNVKEGQIESPFDISDAKTFMVHADGLRSSQYGDLEFQTPISELKITHVTPEEARMYERWRNGYQSNWSNSFDPIAIRFALDDQSTGVDLTVMPLIDSTQYRQMIDLAGKARLTNTSGDRHEGALLSWMLALDPDSQVLRTRANWTATAAAMLGVDPLSWVGNSIHVYIDDDPFWKDFMKWREDHPNDEVERFFTQHVHRLPLALHVETRSALKLTAFLASLRGFIEQTAPGMTRWEMLKHGDLPYVRIGPTEEARANIGPARNLGIYYAVSPEGLTLTLSESTLKRALDRRKARQEQAAAKDEATTEKASAAVPTENFTGQSLFVEVDRRVIDFLSSMFGDDYQSAMQRLSWNNLPILNEWKRRFPDSDPVTLHEDFWKVRLVCPGGGEYRWNEQDQTMESTVYGHPAAPKTGPAMPLPLNDVRRGTFGLTFEPNGLRANVRLDK